VGIWNFTFWRDLSLSLGMNFCRFSSRGRNDQGTKWPGTKWPRDKMYEGTKWPGQNDRVQNERGRSVMPPVWWTRLGHGLENHKGECEREREREKRDKRERKKSGREQAAAKACLCMSSISFFCTQKCYISHKNWDEDFLSAEKCLDS
jgi:hypothetical protein